MAQIIDSKVSCEYLNIENAGEKAYSNAKFWMIFGGCVLGGSILMFGISKKTTRMLRPILIILGGFIVVGGIENSHQYALKQKEQEMV